MQPARRTLIPAVAIVMVIGILGVPSAPPARASASQGDDVLPPARALGGMAFDSTGHVVLFGGVKPNGTPLGDTWTWNGTSWTRRHPADSPSARSNFAMAYDGARHQVVLFGGADQQGLPLDDTWVWDGVTWTEKHPAHTAGFTNLGESMAYDAARRQIVYTVNGFPGDQTWIWNGIDWRQVFPASSPPTLYFPQVTYDFALKRVVEFGGGEDCFEDICGLDDTWLWNGVNWKELEGIQHPPQRFLHAMAYDYLRQAVVVFGGNGGVGGTGLLGDTWTWNGGDWTPVDPVHSPDARSGAMMAWDPQEQVLVLFGGGDFVRDFQDTWTWGGSDWTCVSGCP